ncbi:MAG: hypothetical protein A2X58_06440 [Nitrospirae bacterium GWC2_56_14]|nr:MAG: hypothetical protein A2X58_06440 [Nitrospirae bacterium GWC2_56_14]
MRFSFRPQPWEIVYRKAVPLAKKNGGILFRSIVKPEEQIKSLEGILMNIFEEDGPAGFVSKR